MENLGIFNRIWCDLSFISGNGFGGALCCFQGRNKSNNEGGAVEEREREREFLQGSQIVVEQMKHRQRSRFLSWLVVLRNFIPSNYCNTLPIEIFKIFFGLIKFLSSCLPKIKNTMGTWTERREKKLGCRLRLPIVGIIFFNFNS